MATNYVVADIRYDVSSQLPLEIATTSVELSVYVNDLSWCRYACRAKDNDFGKSVISSHVVAHAICDIVVNYRTFFFVTAKCFFFSHHRRLNFASNVALRIEH